MGRTSLLDTVTGMVQDQELASVCALLVPAHLRWYLQAGQGRALGTPGREGAGVCPVAGRGWLCVMGRAPVLTLLCGADLPHRAPHPKLLGPSLIWAQPDVLPFPVLLQLAWPSDYVLADEMRVKVLSRTFGNAP